MKKFPAILLFICLFAGSSFASPHRDPREGMKPSKSMYKLSKKKFVEMYGKDDSAKALIDIFYIDRRIGFYVLPVYPIIVVCNGIFQTKPNFGDIAAGHPAMVGIVGGVTTLTGGYFLLSSTRKNLYKELKYYEVMGCLSDEYRIRVRQRLYKKTKACAVKPPPVN